jgi:hypothetical protein
MRQIGDLAVWVALVMVLAAAVYFTPRFAAYMSGESRESVDHYSSRSLVFNPPITTEDTN